MTSRMNRWPTKTLTMLLMLVFLASVLASQQGADYTFRIESDLILVSVTVRDKNGNIVSNLKPEDFIVLEDNKAQKIVSFDIENVDAVAMQCRPNAVSAGVSSTSESSGRIHFFHEPRRPVQRPKAYCAFF